MTKTENTPTRVGRERTCTQCGATYRSPRNSSRYCSPACRKRANRGTAPTGGPKAGPAGWSIITKALVAVGYVGRIGPATSRSRAAPTYGLVVPDEHALNEISFQFNRKGFGHVSREEFTQALKRDGIQSFTSRSPEAAKDKRQQDALRQWRKRRPS